jgi:hypothetical protein
MRLPAFDLWAIFRRFELYRLYGTDQKQSNAWLVAVDLRLNDPPALATVALGAEADVLGERDRRRAIAVLAAAE